MCWYGINPSYKVPHVRSFTPFPIPLAYPYQYPIYPPYTIIGDLIGAPETVENALLEAYKVESVQDFLIKLGIKPLMHLVEISTFSLSNVTVRLTKIMNRANKNWAHF